MAIIQMSVLSNCFRRTVPVSVVLPVENFQLRQEDEPKDLPEMNPGPLKTLYLLNGYLGDQTDWLTYSSIRQLAEENRLAVVMPAAENAFYVNNETTGNFYGDFVGKELPALMQRIFPLSDRREDTFIGGISMGGYGALLTAFTYPEKFSSVFALSGALQICENRPEAGNVNLPYIEGSFGPLSEGPGGKKNPRHVFLQKKAAGAAGPIPRVFMACGTEDRLVTLSRLYRDFFRENGVDLTYSEGPGGHEWNFWNGYIRQAVEWLPLAYA